MGVPRLGIPGLHQVAGAWITFQGNAGTPGVATAYNVTSLTDNAVGDWTLTFGSAFAATAYVVVGWGQDTGTLGARLCINNTGANATTSCRVMNRDNGNTLIDPPILSYMFFGTV